jgi:hypothetical protein
MVMDWFNETPVYGFLEPQLLGVKILEICAVVLLVLALLTLLVGWLRHLSWRVRLSALLPLAASVAAGIAAHALHDIYVSWVGFLNYWLPVSYPLGNQILITREITDANQTATVLGWVGIIVTGVLLALSLLGVWYLLVPGRRRHVSASVAIESSASAPKGHQGW